MKLNEVFTKTNVMILSLVAVFLSLGVFFFYRARGDQGISTGDSEIKAISVAMEEMSLLKEESNYSHPSEEEIKQQMLELENLRNN